MLDIDLGTERVQAVAERLLTAKAERQEALATTAKVEAAAAIRLEKNVLAQTDLRREYRWYGPITLPGVADCIETLDRWAHRDPREPITMVFNSPGGDVTAGFNLFDYLQELRERGHHVTTVAMGMAASMGAILLQAGDERIVSPRASMLIHELSSQSQGRMTELEIEMEFMKKLQTLALDILSERATVTRATISKRMTKGNWWISADDCLKYGLADKLGRAS